MRLTLSILPLHGFDNQLCAMESCLRVCLEDSYEGMKNLAEEITHFHGHETNEAQSVWFPFHSRSPLSDWLTFTWK